ncbi:DUF3551 domain-containing protein [Bradyrhizobium sp. Tv2a-2]|uniref:DUF3551 domain-containing protein n=1 Tax=Bradyrhizobium sp. Tv2a-2 TaxID=113395 RepID=UPI000423185E|nr:DUF3551 domain-containing protein [Bradyrhizobium sp. Tv2a-2]
MRRILLALLAISTAGAIHAAAAGGYPYCLRGCDFGAGDCSFYTYQQCLATASGRDAWCDANPSFHQAREPQAVRYSRRRP